MIKTSVSILAVASMLSLGCSRSEPEKTGHESNYHEAGEAVHWGYDLDDGPDQWGGMSDEWSLCATGRSQSPIDLGVTVAVSIDPVDVNRPTEQKVQVVNQAGVIKELDNGHTIQVNAQTGEVLSSGGKSYPLVQFHFHAPSEHTINGEHFPMEVHFVHQSNDGALAVMGVLIKEGVENPGIAPLWAHLPEGPGAEATVEIPSLLVEFMFPEVGSGLYHYEGSLTTPPCSEGVRWYVRKTHTEFSAEQIATFTSHYNHNNRPTQPLNGRTVSLDENPDVTVRQE